MNEGPVPLALSVLLGVVLGAALLGLMLACVAAELAILRVRAARLALLEGGGQGLEASAAMGRRLHTLLLFTRTGESAALMILGLAVVPLLGSALASPWGGAADPAAQMIGSIIAFVTLLVIAVLVGQQVPRALVAAHPTGALRALEPTLRRAAVLARPLVALIEALERILLGRFGLAPAYEREGAHSEADLQVMISTSKIRGVLDSVEQDLASASLEFGALMVSDIMVPRIDVAALADDCPLAEARKSILSAGHDWFPVYHGNRDDIRGVIEWRSLFFDEGPGWSERMSAAFFLPETMSASGALAKMRAAQVEMAIALDEHGGTAGIITGRSLFEELTRIGSSFTPGMEISGRTPLRVVETLLDAELGDENQISTIGGLLTARLGHLALAGETVIIAGWRFEVSKVARASIAMIRVSRESDPVETEEGDEQPDL